METNTLKKFAASARRQLLAQVAARLEQVLASDSVEIREKQQAVKELQEKIRASSRKAVIDQVAYTWFNRFCALRYMDANRYTPVGIVSPVAGFSQPEILQDAKQGVIDDFIKVDKKRVLGLLNGQIPSGDPQQEAYRLLLVGACNAYHDRMPFMFEKIADYTELLMPEDLLSENAVLHGVREALTEEACRDVEVIGWLYQFYISERKDEVFASKEKIAPEDIPAATQLFTPHWIVRYLVENSLGRLWLLNRPGSKLKEKMDYYIEPVEPEEDFLKISGVEEIKVLDPACGSGHMLTYAFDLLQAIYTEEGYDPVDIPQRILENNLFGIEIDERAGALAAFALAMKGRAADRRFLTRGVKPNVLVMENVSFTQSELDAYRKAVGPDLFTQPLWETLGQFEEAKTFGSLIRPIAKNPGELRRLLAEKGVGGDLFLHGTHQKVLKVLEMAQCLSPRYHVVVANPPYMGRRSGMNDILKSFILENYPHCRADLYAAFMQLAFDVSLLKAYPALLTMQSWLFLSSYIGIREKILRDYSITSMVHLGPRAFLEIGGEVVQVVATAMINSKSLNRAPLFVRLVEGNSNEKESQFFIISNRYSRLNQSDFLAIPNFPITYWLPNSIISLFSTSATLDRYSEQRQGLATGNDEHFLRYWFEIGESDINWMPRDFPSDKFKWYLFIKGGTFRKWYGNNEHCILFNTSAFEKLANQGNALPSKSYYLRESIVWSDITSSSFGARYNPHGKVFATGALSAFPRDKKDFFYILGYLNSLIHNVIISAISSGIHYSVGYVDKSPLAYFPNIFHTISNNSEKAVGIVREDWDAQEISWDFRAPRMLLGELQESKLTQTYKNLSLLQRKNIIELISLETENNEAFLVEYGMDEEFRSRVHPSEITLLCNPQYRYGPGKTDEHYESLLLADTLQEFISYAVGCMFGRYSLDKPGLVLANAGETIEDYRSIIEDHGVAWEDVQFVPDADNVIPILEGEWFEDDIAERFKRFLRVTFGEEHFDENLAFIESAIGRDIRSYFVRDFYDHHTQMYKKRPIYWLFSSPKGSFNALIYMHRYRPDTLSVILNGYLRQYRAKLGAHRAHLESLERNPSASAREKTRALKEKGEIDKILAELKEYEDDVLYPLASRKIEIDLDDGVKVNYNKFGAALRKVSGLSD